MSGTYVIRWHQVRYLSHGEPLVPGAFVQASFILPVSAARSEDMVGTVLRVSGSSALVLWSTDPLWGFDTEAELAETESVMSLFLPDDPY